MLLSAILSYLPYSLATAFTPGPNNILALYSVSQKGWRRGKKYPMRHRIRFSQRHDPLRLVLL